MLILWLYFFFSSRRRHTRSLCDWSSDVCSSDLGQLYCDGRSTCSGAGTLNPNGVSLPWTFIGSYTLGADGRGQVTYDQTVAGNPAPQLHIDFVVMSNGNELRGMPTDSGYIVTCELARQ